MHQGRIIAASDRLDHKGLTLMITQRGWMTERVITKMVQISPNALHTPLGLFLKSQGMLQSEQVKLLFNTQVLRPICTLFQVEDGQFTFDAIASLPIAEMTGISMSATEVILMGLRALRDWRNLTDQLPECTSALSSLMTQPQIQLNAQEWQLWEFVNGNVSLNKIANHLRISVEIVQQIAFRLIVVGLVEEQFIINPIPIPISEEPTISMTMIEAEPEPITKPAISHSFLQNLVGFLRNNK